MDTNVRKVNGFPGYYVSADGEVFQMSGKLAKLVTQTTVSTGMMVSIKKGDAYTTRMVHVLVGEAFCDRPAGATFVKHRNGNKADNRAENLEWVTKKVKIGPAYEALRQAKTEKKRKAAPAPQLYILPEPKGFFRSVVDFFRRSGL